MTVKFITNEQLYKEVIEPISRAISFVWIGTADIKDLHIRKSGSIQSFLSILDSLLKKKVAIRLLHAKEPGSNFKNSFDKYPMLWDRMERQLCPRVHFKHIIVDGKFAYTGSANLTGAGLGIKSSDTRNFESGIITTNPDIVSSIMSQFDDVWIGRYCKTCKRRDFCGDPII